MVAGAPIAFFSYSRDDSAFALRLAGELKAAGANVWMDQIDINPGEEWDNAIEAAVTQSPWMLLILSPASVKSKNVRNEISFALDENKTIIPVLYQDCAIPLQLHRIQFIDFRSEYARAFKTLLKVLGVESPGPGSATTAPEVPPTGTLPDTTKFAAQSGVKNKSFAEDSVSDDEQIDSVKRARRAYGQKRSAAPVHSQEHERDGNSFEYSGGAPEKNVQGAAVSEARGPGEHRLLHDKSIPDWIKVLIAVFAVLLIAWAVRSALTTSHETGEKEVAAAKALYATGKYSPAIPLLETAVKAGNAEARFLLSLHYDADFPMFTGVSKDPNKSVELCRPAAEAGITDAMVSMAWSYQKGLGVEKDYAQALSWFHKAADAGNAGGMVGLGEMYGSGYGVEKDELQAAGWYRKAAEAGNLSGIVRLGFAYQNGAGVPQSYSEAMKWYRKAAETKERSHPWDFDYQSNAMVLLGNLYRDGLGVPQSYGDALFWYARAADVNYPDGLFALAMIYENGWGVTKDLQRAIDLYRRAARLQNQDAKAALTRLGQSPE